MTIIDKLLICGLTFAISSCRTESNPQDVKILPSRGIEINGRLFLLNQTSYNQTLSCFNIKDTLNEYSSTALVFDSEGTSQPCIETFQKRIDYQNISFFFTGQRRDSLKLDIIEIRLNGPLTVSLDGKQIENTTVAIPSKYPNSIRFPVEGEDVHGSIFQENESDHGIIFCIDSIQNSIKLDRLFIQKRSE